MARKGKTGGSLSHNVCLVGCSLEMKTLPSDVVAGCLREEVLSPREGAGGHFQRIRYNERYWKPRSNSLMNLPLPNEECLASQSRSPPLPTTRAKH